MRVLPETYCEDCDHVSRTRDSDPTWRWLCMKHPRLRGTGFATRELWDKDSPYLRCVDVNGGACELFEPKRKEPENAA